MSGVLPFGPSNNLYMPFGPSNSLRAGNTELLLRAAANAVGSLLVLNYFGGSQLLSTGPMKEALVIGVLSVIIGLYLPRAELFIDSSL